MLRFMIKKLFLFLVIIFIILIMAISATALAEPDLIVDGAGLLTEEEMGELNARGNDIRDSYKCEISIVVLGDIGNKDSYEYAKSFYKKYNYGYGEEKSGLMLFINMEERDCHLITYGYANTAFTGYGKDILLDEHIIPHLADGNYFYAFWDYFRQSENFLRAARAGSPMDINQSTYQDNFAVKLAITIILPLIIGAVVCFGLLRQMKTAVPKRSANKYILEKGINIGISRDVFLYKRVKRTTIENSNLPRKRGGGTTVDKEGFSGKSRKF